MLIVAALLSLVIGVAATLVAAVKLSRPINDCAPTFR